MKQLEEIQRWFGKTISQPLTEKQTLPKGCGADKYIAPSPTLNAHQRIELYYQQYWWRLLGSLQTNFPTVTRLFGYSLFQQQLAIPYLTQHPPTHWALCRLGETFPDWIAKNYQKEDRYLVLNAARIDWAAQKAFWVKDLPKVDFGKLSKNKILNTPLVLQPHLKLFSLQGDLFSFRETFLENEPDYYTSHPFPKMNFGECHFVLYRTLKNRVSWEKISLDELNFLKQFQKPRTIDQVCSIIEQTEKIVTDIPIWFQKWTVFEWFGLSLSSL